MEAIEFDLKVTYKCGEKELTKQLIYRGNENIIFRCEDGVVYDDKSISLRFSKNLVESFLKLIENE